MYVYIYQSHLGDSDYVSLKKLSDKELYCETHGCTDWLKAEGEAEVLLKQERMKVKYAIEDYRILQDMLSDYVKKGK